MSYWLLLDLEVMSLLITIRGDVSTDYFRGEASIENSVGDVNKGSNIGQCKFVTNLNLY